MKNDLNLNGMLYFEAVARLGRVSKAAGELGISASAVSQQIRLLEEQFGVRLFRREKRQLSLTQEGERLYQTSSVAFRMIREARQVVARRRENRQLILRVSPSFGVRWLGPRLADFIQTHDTWDLRVDAQPDPTDFEREVVDMDLRYGAGNWSGLYLEPILNDYVVPMCSPKYLRDLHDRVGRLPPQELLAEARLIDSIKTLYRWDFWLARNRIPVGDGALGLRFDRSSMAIQMAMRDVGVVLESVTLAYQELSGGALVPFSPSFEILRFPAYWIVSPSRHQNRRIVQLFSTWLRQQAAVHDEAALHLLQSFGCSVTHLGNLSQDDLLGSTPERGGAAGGP
ncbi:MAG: LysR family transcriptional regulator [Rhodospirillum sp.]|nr:LysR family transcriptional regulator [Rhodospirillum sp.]MCF8489730.1 LysR family transcriptional regulator [Rhodospirillum sp.]